VFVAHRYSEPVEVSALTYPEAFVWRGRSYEVVRVLRRWRERGEWWAQPRAPEVRVEFWRVEARDPNGLQQTKAGVFDLALDLTTGAWRLETVWD
jgi:hypothetical protein